MTDVGTTWASQIIQGWFGGAKGAASDSCAFPHIQNEKPARRNKKKRKQAKLQLLKQVTKKQRIKGKQHKNSNKKRGKESQQGRTRSTSRDKIFTKTKDNKEADRNRGGNAPNGNCCHEKKPATRNIAKIKWTKWVKKKTLNKKKNNQQCPHHPISYSKNRAHQHKASAIKKKRTTAKITRQKDSIKHAAKCNKTNFPIT